jgi:hypothetical protein
MQARKQVLSAVEIGGSHLYFQQIAHFAPLTIANLLVVVLSYDAFVDPIIFMQVLLVASIIAGAALARASRADSVTVHA